MRLPAPNDLEVSGALLVGSVGEVLEVVGLVADAESEFCMSLVPGVPSCGTIAVDEVKLVAAGAEGLELVSVCVSSPRVRAKSHGKPMSRYSMSNIRESLLNRTCTRTTALSRGSSGRSP